MMFQYILARRSLVSAMVKTARVMVEIASIAFVILAVRYLSSTVSSNDDAARSAILERTPPLLNAPLSQDAISFEGTTPNEGVAAVVSLWYEAPTTNPHLPSDPDPSVTATGLPPTDDYPSWLIVLTSPVSAAIIMKLCDYLFSAAAALWRRRKSDNY